MDRLFLSQPKFNHYYSYFTPPMNTLAKREHNENIHIWRQRNEKPLIAKIVSHGFSSYCTYNIFSFSNLKCNKGNICAKMFLYPRAKTQIRNLENTSRICPGTHRKRKWAWTLKCICEKKRDFNWAGLSLCSSKASL